MRAEMICIEPILRAESNLGAIAAQKPPWWQYPGMEVAYEETAAEGCQCDTYQCLVLQGT